MTSQINIIVISLNIKLKEFAKSIMHFANLHGMVWYGMVYEFRLLLACNYKGRVQDHCK